MKKLLLKLILSKEEFKTVKLSLKYHFTETWLTVINNRNNEDTIYNKKQIKEFELMHKVCSDLLIKIDDKPTTWEIKGEIVK